MSNLTTKALVKEHLDINVTNFDDVIDTVVSGVNQALENYIGTTFTNTTYTDEEYDMVSSSRILVLRHRPVITFTRLQYKNDPSDFEDTDWTSFDASHYVVDLDTGVITKNTEFNKGKRKYLATYSAGYASIPDDITLAATKLAAALVESRKGAGVVSETLGQYSRTFAQDRATWKNLDIEWIINKYKNLNVAWFESAFIPGGEPRDFAADN